MRSLTTGILLVLGLLLALGGCASSDQWADWKGHSSHFASGRHLTFSARNPEGAKPRVRRPDMDAAAVESWWGKPVMVAPEEIIQN
jgi:hypothetical protein